MAVKNSTQNKHYDLTTPCSLVADQHTGSIFMLCKEGNYLPRNQNIK